MVGVCIVTYNQEEYIEMSINSALRQKCSEDIVVYVADDCSTDQTSYKCRLYGKKIRYVRREKNEGLVRNTMLLFQQMIEDGCDYIAMLDGDDFWCDELKCQKQIDYFKSHNDVGLIHTCIYRLYPYGLKKDKRKHDDVGYVFETVDSISIGNCSVMFKSYLLNYIDFEDFMSQKFWSCDYVMYCIFSKFTNFGFIPEHTAVWRRGHDTISNLNNLKKQIEYAENGVEMWKYLNKLYPDRWPYTESGANEYRAYYSFNVAFCGCNKALTKEYKRRLLNMNQQLGLKMKVKLIVSSSYIAMKIWNFMKYIKNRMSNYY